MTSRRDFLRTAALAAAATAIPRARAQESPVQPPDFTVGFLTDTHVDEQRGAAEAVHAKAAVTNCHEVLEVLQRHPVKLVLAGHLHINESYCHKGIELANVGAVSGGWWEGPQDGCEEGYTLLDFRGEQVSWRYVDYGWTERDA